MMTLRCVMNPISLRVRGDKKTRFLAVFVHGPRGKGLPRKISLCHTAPTTLAGLAAAVSLINANTQGDELLRTYANHDDIPNASDDEDQKTCMGPVL